ncbi:acyl carrier protein [Amycolatopsis panacis]|uniref:Acyl carrier protein n=1 Tax=Amycolatopsis panacis TaxID=2340917 RepID=A0A419I952_9PSEU|nr:phosphopantetheine-binding protein [Amycolatopsis panacis]RJQ89083.1 acyl carrier protein [Amycolatopsis panacis]
MSSEPAVDAPAFETVCAILRDILGEYEAEDVEIAPDSSFHEDLQLESIDLVALAGRLRDHYGERINLAEWLADKDLDEVIELTVGQLAGYVESRR